MDREEIQRMIGWHRTIEGGPRGTEALITCMVDKMAWIRKTGLKGKRELKHTEIFYEEIGIGHEYGIDSSK